MSEPLPPSGFDASRYQRPNQRWICGRAAEGQPCPLGPGRWGGCRATAECSPVLEKKPGEDKGRWKCARPGGACEQGPLPDGQCCRPIPRCAPLRSLRSKRGLFTWAVVAVTAGALLVLLGGSWRNLFLDPGGLADPHSGPAFAALAGKTNRADHQCAACHSAGLSGPRGLLRAAFTASPGPLEFHMLPIGSGTEPTAIDAACARCHTRHSFHQPSVAREQSCAHCHPEHLGAGPMRAPNDTHCAACHGDEAVMIASAEKGKTLPASAFEFLPGHGLKQFRVPRPAEGFTRVFRSFADHPEFRVHADRGRDPNTLRFGHALHLTGDTIPRLPGGRALGCADCHQPDARGAHFQPVRFEQHCRACHSLQFDPESPELTLPHGQPEFVSAFLHSLARQYDTYARERKGLRRDDEAAAFVQARLRALQDQHGSRGELEKRVFFSTSTHGPAAQAGAAGGPARALYPGCAYCHEVRPDADGGARVTPGIVPDRWLPHGEFNHAKHTQVSCAACHDAKRSRETSDVILPSKQTCAGCHSAAGGVRNNCSTCHGYHNSPPDAVAGRR